MEITALRGRMLPPLLLLRLLAVLLEVLLPRLADEVLAVLGRVPEEVVDGLEPLLGEAEPLGLLLLGLVLLEGLLPLLGTAVPDGLVLGALLLLGLLAAGAFAEGCEVVGLFSASTGSVLAGRS